MDNISLTEIRVAILTLGCKVNSYESEAMSLLLTEMGAKMVDFEENADVYIVNTCSVTNIADRKSRQMLHKAIKNNPNAVVIAAGCYVQALSEKERESLGVDGIIGNNRKNEIGSLILECLKKKNERLYSEIVCDISKEQNYEDMAAVEAESHTRAYIKIQDGCNQFCTYCIIPYTRGRIRSRSEESVISEAQGLVKAGFKEIVLTGIHLSSYTNGELSGGDALLALIKKLAEIPELLRIRLGSLEPRVATAEFARDLAAIDKVCPHFHLSLQSGSETVLKRMNRKYSPKQYLEGCDNLRKYFDNPALTTDIIVGFPGETEEEFEETLAFAETVKFSKIHVFKYSRRRGTVADKMPDQIPENIKNARSRRLISLEEKMGREYAEGFKNREISILTEEKISVDGKEYLTGYTERYVRCAIPAENKKANTIETVFARDMKEDLLYCD